MSNSWVIQDTMPSSYCRFKHGGLNPEPSFECYHSKGSGVCKRETCPLKKEVTK